MTPSPVEKVIDGRDLEPPEPFVQTMDALDTLEAGQTLLLLLRREPFPLYRALELNGVAWTSTRNSAGDFEIRMRRQDESASESAPRADCPSDGAA